MLDNLRSDIRTARKTDPAAHSTAEVLLYAGVHAVWLHRLAHWLDTRGHRLAARVLAQCSRWLTGVEIDPGAELGDRVFIDHGMGVVVGETAEIGDDVNMYHGVTLGGNDPRPIERHPTVEDGVTLGARSTLVGDITIGEGATVGAGAVVVDDVSPGATVAGNPAERIDEPADRAERSGDVTSEGVERTEHESDGRGPQEVAAAEGNGNGCPPEPTPAWVPGS
jgi:serine O-acetyltransferase